MRTWRNACLRSPASATGFRRFLTSTSHSRFWRGGPVSKQSFNDGLFSFDSWSIEYNSELRGFCWLPDDRLVRDVKFSSHGLCSNFLYDSFRHLVLNNFVILSKEGWALSAVCWLGFPVFSDFHVYYLGEDHDRVSIVIPSHTILRHFFSVVPWNHHILIVDRSPSGLSWRPSGTSRLHSCS